VNSLMIRRIKRIIKDPFNPSVPILPYFQQYNTLYSEKDNGILQRGRFRERLLLVGI